MAAAALFNGALFARLVQSFNDLKCVKNNPVLASLVPVLAFVGTFIITFTATTLSILTCPLHLKMDGHKNMTEFCYNVVLKLQHQQNVNNEEIKN